MQTYVYGDLYRYDVDKNEWKLISSPNSPPPRSAHQAVAWKNYLYIYGKNNHLHGYLCVQYMYMVVYSIAFCNGHAQVKLVLALC